MIIENLVANVETAKQIVKFTISSIPDGNEDSPAYRALEKSVATNLDVISDKIKKKLDLIIGGYL